MKLLFCPKCDDMFKLTYKHKSCECGEVTGNYIDNTNAVTNGKGISVAIGNGSFIDAYNKLKFCGDKEERDFYINSCRIVCWIRPNEGSGNFHTKIKGDE